MNLLKYMFLAILQGITEPIPVSSSGHMRLFDAILNNNLNVDLNYEIICNFGSFLAIFFIFRKDILKLITDFYNYIFIKEKKETSKNGFKYCLYIVISTIPVIITGLLFKNAIETRLSSMMFLGLAFLLTSISLLIVRNFKGEKNDFDITLKDAIIIGLFQSITIIPGISRSGTVLVACLLCGLKRDSALKYTFILYFPVSLGSMILGTKDIIQAGNIEPLLLPYFIGLIISGIFTFITYKWMSNWVKKGKLLYFSIYCFILAIFVFLFFN